MTHTTTTPAPVRTDRQLPEATASAAITTSGIRAGGVVLAAGTAAWAAANYAFGFEPDTSWQTSVTDLTGFAFQVGVMALLTVQLKTRAAGTSNRARNALRVERVLLSVAMLWSLIHGLFPAARDEAWLSALDVFWPLSMLGMFFIGIKVFASRRWRGPARVWSLLAETWAPVSVPAMAILGHGGGDVVGATHLLLGYATLGVIIAARPHLVEDRG